MNWLVSQTWLVMSVENPKGFTTSRVKGYVVDSGWSKNIAVKRHTMYLFAVVCFHFFV
jgi:hypothetical protein